VLVAAVPYHLDDYLPDLDLPITPVRVVTADMPPGEVWDRLPALYARVAATVTYTTRDNVRAVVMSGDCMTWLAIITGCKRRAWTARSCGSTRTVTCRPWRPPPRVTSAACRWGS